MNNLYQYTKKEGLNDAICDEIKELERICMSHEPIAFKLELDYKLAYAKEHSNDLKDMNEFLCYEASKLVGYIGICAFGGGELEINGMVHPEHRRKGVFSHLFNELCEEVKSRSSHTMLLLSDRRSEAGIAFTKKLGATYFNTEYEMSCDLKNRKKMLPVEDFSLRRAVKSDAMEIQSQNTLYFGDEDIEIEIDIEEEERLGSYMYLAEYQGEVVGKVNLQVSGNSGGLYGLGIKPAFRGKGFGKSLLVTAMDEIEKFGCDRAFLQVSATNDTALGLYLDSGFIQQYVMDYYRLSTCE